MRQLISPLRLQQPQWVLAHWPSACARSRSAASTAVGRSAGCAAMHAAISSAAAAGQSSGTRSARIAARTGTSPAQISHSTTPRLKMSACNQQI